LSPTINGCPNSKATGAAMIPSTFKKYAKEAGFSKIEPVLIFASYIIFI
jgi:hypothetical protein